MLFRARRAMSRAWFNLQCKDILRTPVLHAEDERTTLVSMVCHGEVLMYLLAAKSFCRRLLCTPKIVVLDDGSLTSEDRALITRHLVDVQIVSISDVAVKDCPKGSCWERLWMISELASSSYVIQLDCDTLTVDSIPEVEQCIAEGRSFSLLGDRSYPQVESMRNARERLKDNPSAQVQAVCERSFHLLPESENLKYLRGNAGFTGFAKGSIWPERVQWFSLLMRRIAGAQWDEWGSEQVTSNLLIANSKEPCPLQAPKYLSYWAHPDVPYERAAFLHFIGPHRYANGFYLRQARRVITALH